MNPVGCWEITVSHINCVNLLLIKLINDKTSYFSIHSSILQARSVLVFFSECSVFFGFFCNSKCFVSLCLSCDTYK